MVLMCEKHFKKKTPTNILRTTGKNVSPGYLQFTAPAWAQAYKDRSQRCLPLWGISTWTSTAFRLGTYIEATDTLIAIKGQHFLVLICKWEAEGTQNQVSH